MLNDTRLILNDYIHKSIHHTLHILLYPQANQQPQQCPRLPLL
jgi:hypothetical protein